jgi:hypothetical protein
MLATMMFLLEANEAHAIKQWDGHLSNVMGYIFIQKDAAARRIRDETAYIFEK